jgi:hypothetical protein
LTFTGLSVFGDDSQLIISLFNRYSHIASLVSSEQAIYSTSRVDRATTDWDFACQKIDPPSIKIYPSIDFLVRVPPLQHESVNPINEFASSGEPGYLR